MGRKSRPRRRGAPLGTGSGIFYWIDDRVVTQLVRCDPIEMIYQDERCAEAACLQLQLVLVDSYEATAVALRTRYSSDNVLRFLQARLPWEGLQAMRWTTSIRLDENGLRAHFPTGEWLEVHVENVSAFEFDEPTRRLGVDLTPPVQFIYDHFRVNGAFAREGRGRISYLPSDFFGEQHDVQRQ